MDEMIYERLIDIARNKIVIYYEDLAPLVGLDMSLPPDRKRIGEYLDEINQHEHNTGAPLLTAVVVQKNTKFPGQGFFKLARAWGLFSGNDEITFYVNELKKVYTYWANQ